MVKGKLCPDCGYGNLIDFDAASAAVTSIRTNASMAKENLAAQYRKQNESTRNWMLASLGFLAAVLFFTFWSGSDVFER